MEIEVMAKAALLSRIADAWLLRVYLPWMHIKDKRAPLHAVYPSEPPTGDRVGEEAEVSAAGDWEVLSGEAKGGYRNLSHAPAIVVAWKHAALSGQGTGVGANGTPCAIRVFRDGEGVARPIRDAVEVVADREDAGVVAIASFQQFVICPEAIT
jgi:hypothetical protein